MARNVRIATCSVPGPRLEHDGPTDLRQRCLALAREAGERDADIVCLPEFSGSEMNADGSESFVAHPIPGPVTDALADLAARHRMYVIGCQLEDVGQPKAYNTAFLLDRDGHLVGKYHKTHLCLPDCHEADVAMPGQDVPVFPTDFGTIGITICMDIHYPELYTVLALQGAEVIFWPSAAMDYTGDLIESMVNTRAVDNQVHFVTSHYLQQPYLAGKHMGHSRVVDCMGRTRADTGHLPGVAVADVDLDQTYPMWYTDEALQRYPTMRQTIFKTRRPELYGKLVEPIAPDTVAESAPRR